MQLFKTPNGFVGEKQQLRIQVEWDETLLLFQATYHKYDDVGRVHNYQMRSGELKKRKENHSQFSMSLTQEGNKRLASGKLQFGKAAF